MLKTQKLRIQQFRFTRSTMINNIYENKGKHFDTS